jgi:hypothetical protein
MSPDEMYKKWQEFLSGEYASLPEAIVAFAFQIQKETRDECTQPVRPFRIGENEAITSDISLLRKYAQSMHDYQMAENGSDEEKQADESSNELEAEILRRMSNPAAQPAPGWNAAIEKAAEIASAVNVESEGGTRDRIVSAILDLRTAAPPHPPKS